ncbi:MAG: hypothetical protein AB1640_23535 [bacterium]
MNHADPVADADSAGADRARRRMAFWPLLMYLIGLVWAYLSVPFEGHTSAPENVVYSVLVAGPFWIAMLVFLVVVRRDGRAKP